MAKTYKQPGKVYDHIAAADISSGDVVIMSTVVGVALTDIATGDTGSVQTKEVFELAKLASSDIAQGDAVYWDATNSQINKTASGNTRAGVAAMPAGNGVLTVWVDLNA